MRSHEIGGAWFALLATASLIVSTGAASAPTLEQRNVAALQRTISHPSPTATDLGGPVSTQVPLPAGFAAMTRGRQAEVVAKVVVSGGVKQLSSTSSRVASLSPLAAGCQSAWSRFREAVDWCYNGSSVTSISPIRVSAYVYGPFVLAWTLEGTRERAQWSPGGSRWYFRNYAQGSFKYAPPPKLWTIFVEDPHVYLDVNGSSGGASWSGGRL